MMKRFISISLIMALVVGAFAQSDLQVLAVVKHNKSESITVKQLKTRVTAYEKQAGRALSVAERKQTLDALIDEKLVNQAALKSGISVPNSAVDQNFLQQMSQMVGKEVTEQELSKIIKEQTKLSLDEFMKQQVGMSVAEYKDYIKSQVIAQQYILQQRQAELQKIAPTDKDIRDFYEMNKASFVWSDMLKLFLVYVPKDKSPDTAKKRATEMLADLKTNQNKKATRDQVVVRSNANNSDYQAGELLINKTEISATQLGVPYRVLLDLFSKDINYISEIQDNDTNYQFYSIVEKYGAKMLGLSDIVRPDTTITVYNYIKQNLAQQQQMEYLQNAANEIAKSLDTKENVDRKKTGADLDKLLNW